MREMRGFMPSIRSYPHFRHGGAVHADGIVSSSVVGYSSRSVEAKHWYMIAAQFKGVAESDLVVKISDLMSMTLTPGEIGDGVSDPTYANAPMIQVLKANGTGYNYYYYVSDAGVTGDDDDPWNQTGWIDGGTCLLVTETQVPVGQAFWIHSTGSAGRLTFSL